MIAMELDGRHIGRTVKLKYRKTVKSKADTITNPIKITQVYHSRSGNVTLKQSRYNYNNYKTTIWQYPHYAEVTFLDV